MLQDGLFFCRTHLEPPGISKKPNPSLAYSALPADSSVHHRRRALCHPVSDQPEFDEPDERGLRSLSVCHGVFPSRRLDSARAFHPGQKIHRGSVCGGLVRDRRQLRPQPVAGNKLCDALHRHCPHRNRDGDDSRVAVPQGKGHGSSLDRGGGGDDRGDFDEIGGFEHPPGCPDPGRLGLCLCIFLRPDPDCFQGGHPPDRSPGAQCFTVADCLNSASRI